MDYKDKINKYLDDTLKAFQPLHDFINNDPEGSKVTPEVRQKLFDLASYMGGTITTLRRLLNSK